MDKKIIFTLLSLLPVVVSSYAANIPANLPNVPSVAALEATAPNPAQFTVNVQSYYAGSNTGGGVFQWNASSTTAVNACGVFAVTGVSTGRWIRVPSSPLDVTMCGAYADDSHDDTTAINAAFTVAAASATLATVTMPATATIKVSGNLSLDVSKVSLNCQGAYLDATGASSGATFTLTSTATSVNQMAGIHYAHPIQNCYLSGPAYTSGVDAFHFTPATISGNPWITGIVLNGVSGTGYRNFIQTSNGVVGLIVMNGAYGSDTNPSQTFLDIDGYTNAGENIRVVNFFLANLVACFNDHGSAGDNVDIFATNVSCDGSNYILTGGATPGSGASHLSVFYTGHIEDTITASSYPINIANGGLDFVSGEWVGSSPGQINHTMCNVTTTASLDAMGLVIQNVQFSDAIGTFTPSGTDPVWCDGTGRVSVSHIAGLGNTIVGIVSANNNLIYNYTDASTGQYTISGSVTRDTGTVPSGATASLKLQETSGTVSATRTVPCGPSQLFGVSGTIETQNVASTGATWNMTLEYLDGGGAILNSNQITASTDNASFTYEGLFPAQLPSNSGTSNCRLVYSLVGGTGTATMWVAFPVMIIH